MDVAQMDFRDNEFEVVICMEVLEHLEREAFLQALSELRRVCSARLIMSVPYEEPEPLSRHHKLRFGDNELTDSFPNASCTVLEGPDVPWVLIEETAEAIPRHR